jgi:hypothetical protein
LKLESSTESRGFAVEIGPLERIDGVPYKPLQFHNLSFSATAASDPAHCRTNADAARYSLSKPTICSLPGRRVSCAHCCSVPSILVNTAPGSACYGYGTSFFERQLSSTLLFCQIVLLSHTSNSIEEPCLAQDRYGLWVKPKNRNLGRFRAVG